MNAGAIDFRQLLKEEKKKARQKQRQPTIISTKDDDEKKEASEITNAPLQALGCSKKVREEDIEAIDFVQLNQRERQEYARRQREKVAQQIQDEQNHAIARQWTFLSSTLEADNNHTFSKQQHQVCSNPPTIYYMPQFFPKKSDQMALMEWLQSLPDLPYQPQEQQDNELETVGWTTLPHAKRRVAVFSSSANNNNFPPMLQRLCQVLWTNIFSQDEPPNHILVNEYHAGQGIMPHTDGPAYASRTATLSLGSSVLIQFTPRPRRDDNNSDAQQAQQRQQKEQHTVQLLLDPGSLVVFEDDAYLEYCHGITDRVDTEQATTECVNAQVGTQVTRGYRISLTFRHKY